MLFHILISVLFLGVFSALILRLPFFRDEHIPRKAFLGAYGLKLLAGLLLWAVYSFHYPLRGTSDAFNYFDDAEALHQALYEAPAAYADILFGTGFSGDAPEEYLQRTAHWDKPYNYGVMNDNRTIIRANMIVRIFSFGYYHVHTLSFCFVSFLGLMALFKSFVRYLPARRYACFFAAFLLPSLLFWGSGVLKEGILLFALGFFILHWTRLLEEGRWRSLPLALLFTLLLLSIKTYVLLAFLPGLFCYMLVRAFRGRYTWSIFAAGHALIAFLVWKLPQWGLGYSVLHMLRLKQRDFYNVAEEHDAGSLIQAPPFESFFDLFLAFPHAVWNAIFRPHLFEMASPLYIPFALENAFLLLGLLFTLPYWRSPGAELRPFYACCLSFVLILAFLIGLVTPVLGAIVRYQIPLLPFYIFVLLCSLDWERLKWRLGKVFG